MGACHGEAASLCGGGVAGEAKRCAGQLGGFVIANAERTV